MTVDAAEFEDYESLPTHSLWIHMVAGAAAGIMEHCTMYPVDAVKTRMQSVSSNCPERNLTSPLRGIVQIWQREGFSRLIRGVQAVAFGAVPAHALYFTVYEKLKFAMIADDHAVSTMLPDFMKHGIAGVAATVAHDAVMNPAEVVKQRMQMFCCPYNSTLECARCVLKSEGMGAFYRSYKVQLLMNIPFHVTHFMVYEATQGHLNPKKRYDPLSHLVSGGVAGGIAAAITTPLDVCKTVLNTQENLYSNNNKCDSMAKKCPPSSVPGKSGLGSHLKSWGILSWRRTHSLNTQHTVLSPTPIEEMRPGQVVVGMREAYKQILRSKGRAGLLSGIQARVLFQVPGTAIAWSVYEFFKFLLDRKDGN